MDTISASQKKIRKSLRNSRRTCTPTCGPEKGRHLVIQPTAQNLAVPRKKKQSATTSLTSEIEHETCEADHDIPDVPTIRKEDVVESNVNIDPKPDDTEMSDSSDNPGNGGDPTDSDNEMEFGADQPMESEGEEECCIESVLKEFNKDIGALYSKTNRIESDLKEIKKIQESQSRPTCSCNIRTISSRFKQKSNYSLLPKLPLLKKSQVRQMESDINDEEKDGYDDQLAELCASYGGDSPNEMVIIIFRKLFSYKLKTKYCWSGSKKEKQKDAFKKFLGIREVIWSAVKLRFGDCTEKTISKEIKLRLNQAPKDYAREKEKLIRCTENQ